MLSGVSAAFVIGGIQMLLTTAIYMCKINVMYRYFVTLTNSLQYIIVCFGSGCLLCIVSSDNND